MTLGTVIYADPDEAWRFARLSRAFKLKMRLFLVPSTLFAATCLLAAHVLLFAVIPGNAQEPVRASLARSLTTQFDPNPENSLFRLGPVQGNLTAGVSLDYVDNAGVSNGGSTSLLRLSENLDMSLFWPVTASNQVYLTLGASYTENLVGNAGDRFTLTLAPDSKITWAIGIGDFRIRLFDAFAVTQDPTSDPSITNVVNLNRFRNNGGVAVDWDLNKLILTAQVDDTYTTQNARTFNQNGQDQSAVGADGNRNTLRGSLQASFQLNPTTFFGPVFSASTSSASSATAVDALSPGLFLSAHLTRLTSLNLEAGLNFVSIQREPDVVRLQGPVHTPGSTYYLRATALQTVNRYVNANLSASHDLDYADGLNVTERTLFTLGASYRLTKAVTLSGNGYYEDGNVLSGINQGRYNRFGVNAGFNYRIGPKLHATLAYRYTQRNSDTGATEAIVADEDGFVTLQNHSGSYSQNEVNLSLNYAF